LEAGWNLRNMATLGGTILSGDGRSPLLTVLLALGAEVTLEPGRESLSLEDLLANRDELAAGRLLTCVRFAIPENLGYEQVARSPADRPLVCASVSHSGGDGPYGEIRVALGGFGAQPIRVTEAESALQRRGGLGAAVKAAADAYAAAGDAWASAEYRSEVAGVLVRRLIAEVES
jgi:CO/xanthine dehydrogenase FAD-binding subunit